MAQPSGGQTQGGGSILGTLPVMIAMMVIFWFILIRPQQKKAKEHAQMLTKLKAGDRVVTSAGIVGTVTHVKDKVVTVRTAGDTKLEFTKGSIAEITESSSETAAS